MIGPVDLRPLAPSVLANLQQWPGEPSLAVVGKNGVISGFDTGRTYPLASVTKLLSALTLLSAVGDGIIAIDDPVGPPGATLRHLLAHASGIGFRDDTIRANPGSRRIYSNTGIDLAAAHLSERTGNSFQTEMRNRVLLPLAMNETSLEGPPSKGGVASIGDMALLAAELLTPRVVSAEAIVSLTTVAYPGLGGFLPSFGYHADNVWGLGAEVRGHKMPHWTSPYNSPTTFGHFGISGSFVWIDQTAGLACVALSSVVFDEWAVTAWPATSTSVLASHSLKGEVDELSEL